MDNNDCGLDKVYVCRAARCKKNGSDELVNLLEKVLKTQIDRNTDEHLIKLESSHCLGQCTHGPNVRANNKIYNHVNRELLKKILSIVKSKLVNSTSS